MYVWFSSPRPFQPLLFLISVHASLIFSNHYKSNFVEDLIYAVDFYEERHICYSTDTETNLLKPTPRNIHRQRSFMQINTSSIIINITTTTQGWTKSWALLSTSLSLLSLAVLFALKSPGSSLTMPTWLSSREGPHAQFWACEAAPPPRTTGDTECKLI